MSICANVTAHDICAYKNVSKETTDVWKDYVSRHDHYHKYQNNNYVPKIKRFSSKLS